MDGYGCSLRTGACGGGERGSQDCDVDEVSIHLSGRTALALQEVRGVVVSFRAQRMPEARSSALNRPRAQLAGPGWPTRSQRPVPRAVLAAGEWTPPVTRGFLARSSSGAPTAAPVSRSLGAARPPRDQSS